MAWDFDASGDWFINSSITAPGMPLTIACWAWSDLSTARAIGGLHGGSNHQHIISFESSTVKAQSRSGAASAVAASSSTTYSTGQWHHVCGVFAAADDRAVYLDGGGKGTNTTSRNPSNDTIALARGNGTGFLLNGRIAEFAVWDAALTDDEVAQLGAGVSPLLVRPINLYFYFPLVRVDPPRCVISGISLTKAGDPQVVSHPGTSYPTGLWTPSFTPSAATGARQLVNGAMITDLIDGGLVA